MYEEYFPEKRFKITLDFVLKHLDKDQRILDLGVDNPFSKILRDNGYSVQNTQGEDLDIDNNLTKYNPFEVLTGFEILEHLLSPLPLLRNAECKKLMVSVPLRYWFAPAYRSKTDKWDRHYHEFEDWQLDWLLEKAGWQIKDRLKWKNPGRSFGIRPLLRNFYDRYYAVYAER